MERLVSLLEACQKSMADLHGRLDVMNSTLQRMEKRLTRCYQCAGTAELESGECLSCNQVNAPCRA